MDSFEDLGVSPELVEALASEGIERPTPLQESAIPVLRKGNNLVLVAGPGSGILVTWAGALLDRIPADVDARPAVLCLTATREVAEGLAEPVARLAQATGHSVAALGSSWVLPERAQILFATPGDVLDAVAAGGLDLTPVEAMVVDQAQLVEKLSGLELVERVLDYLRPETQRVLSALPVTDGVEDLATRHLRRTLRLPAPSADAPPDRGSVRFRIVPEPKEQGVLRVVDELLSDGARHVLVYCRNDDRAADVGDFLSLHGFASGAPGDPSAPIWLGVDALEARRAAGGAEGVAVVSCDAPTDPDTLDRRHAKAEGSVVVVLPRELAHLKGIARLTGYGSVPFPPPSAQREAVAELRATLERALAEEDTAPYMAALEPLFERHDPVEVAAAAVALMRRGAAAGAAEQPAVPPPGERSTAAAPAWAKLFIGVGEQDGLKPGDLLGAITGEAGVDGSAVGRIEIKERHSLVEVHDDVARKVIRAINGTTIKGRAVRADFDRPRRGPARHGRARG